MRYLIIALTLLFAGVAQAGESSNRNIMGFSQDGRYFVFEEFGIGDGAGIPYATLYAIDTESDSWVKGTPVRTSFGESDAPEYRGGSEQKAIDRARAKVKQDGAALLARVGPLKPGLVRAYNPPSEFAVNGKKLRFAPDDIYKSYMSNSDIKVMRLELTELDFRAADNCYNQTENMKGFSLKLIDERAATEKVLSEDTSIPNSRSCPIAYSIEEVIMFHPENAPATLAVLIRFARPGFEGPDGRLLAVTTRLPATK